MWKKDLHLRILKAMSRALLSVMKGILRLTPQWYLSSQEKVVKKSMKVVERAEVERRVEGVEGERKVERERAEKEKEKEKGIQFEVLTLLLESPTLRVPLR
jgi:hypothetical protein